MYKIDLKVHLLCLCQKHIASKQMGFLTALFQININSPKQWVTKLPNIKGENDAMHILHRLLDLTNFH